MDELARLAANLGFPFPDGGTDIARLELLHFAANTLGLLAALLIPAGLVYFTLRRRDFEYRGLTWLFVAAFLAAAVHHGLTLWGMWQPNPPTQGFAEAIATGLALCAAVALWMFLPDALRLPSPRQLRRTNATLTRETWEQQRALQQAQTNTLLLRGLVAQSTVGTALITPQGRWLQVNDGFAAAVGLSRDDLLQREPRELLMAELLDAARAPAVDDSPTKGSEPRWLRWRADTLRDDGGKMLARVIQCYDITAERRAEQNLSRMRQEFEAQAAEQAREAAEAATRLEQVLAEKQKHEAMLSERALQLERSAAQLEQFGVRLTELAGSDPGTGLISSHALASRLELAIGFARRYEQNFSVLVFAADPVDDLEAGSEPLLSALGTVIRAELRDTDAAARCDTERICVLLPHASAATANRVAERVRRRLAATPLAAGDRTLRLTCCVGAAEWKTGQGLSEVLGRAAEALRSARASGRNKSVAS